MQLPTLYIYVDILLYNQSSIFQFCQLTNNVLYGIFFPSRTGSCLGTGIAFFFFFFTTKATWEGPLYHLSHIKHFKIFASKGQREFIEGRVSPEIQYYPLKMVDFK